MLLLACFDFTNALTGLEYEISLFKSLIDTHSQFFQSYTPSMSASTGHMALKTSLWIRVTVPP